tara:strand:- start:1042 stop:1323 length:282 start_codon:yes stop_codon:yes gene_type:complete
LLSSDTSVISTIFPDCRVLAGSEILDWNLRERLEWSPVSHPVSTLQRTPLIKDYLIHNQPAMLIVMMVNFDKINMFFQDRPGITTGKGVKKEG